MENVTLNILPDKVTYLVGDFPAGRIEINASLAFTIKSLRLELVCSMITPQRTVRRAFPVKLAELPVGPVKYSFPVPFTVGQRLFDQSGNYGKTSLEWSLQAKAVVVRSGKQTGGVHNRFPQVLEEKIPLAVERGTAGITLNISEENEEGSLAQVLFLIASLLLLPYLGWGIEFGILAIILYGVFTVEKLLTRRHLLRGLDVKLETDADGIPRFRFVSVLGADDFTGGVVAIKLKERYRKDYVDHDGDKKSRTIRKELLHRFKTLVSARRSGHELICELSGSINDYPVNHDFDEQHGYEWLASYVYPRKYWMDVRVRWDLTVSRKLGSHHPVIQPISPTAESA